MIRLLDTCVPPRRDLLIASVLTLLVLVAYVRTLAPDVLYGDSAEFQTLAYTLGTTHSTGYSVYLSLARLVGFLPLRSPAWRISLFSAWCAALTVGGTYLLARHLKLSHAAALLGALALALSYTFWSQAFGNMRGGRLLTARRSARIDMENLDSTFNFVELCALRVSAGGS